MAELSDLIANLDLFDLDATATTTASDNHHTLRKICTRGCDRPINVCLCKTIPTEPISTCTQVVILHHPHERRHKLATVPVLQKCLWNCEIIIGRRLSYGDSSILDSLYTDAIEKPNEPLRALFLFPGTGTLPSVEINQWKYSFGDANLNNHVLIAFDGTWKHAKEMVHASVPFLSKFAIQVCLNYDVGVHGGTIFDSDLILRKEPFIGCMSTMEAVARCLRVLESNGDVIELRMVEVLRAMVRFQACFLKPMKARPRLFKKGRVDEKKNVKSELPG
ncbi:unnamed protein product [Ilex paraguariensis]|uniref:tRNA-uridine aminocarboxypropyltransferase n=1 Tax=Ilex paraguariensis TaxID=185542 RepID=A0ABC8USA7_9AQUA